MRKVKITCNECHYTNGKGMTFESRKELEDKIKEKMVICTNCAQRIKFSLKWINK